MTKKILLVDNDKFFREFIGGILAHEGYDVTTASDGIEVIEKIDNIRPDAVILDLVMENLDGDQVIAFLRRNTLYKNLPVIVLSGIVGEEMAQTKSIDADIFIPKGDPEAMKLSLTKSLNVVFKKANPDLKESKPPRSGLPIKDIHESIVFELLNKSKNLKLILDNLTEGVLVTDDKFKITYSNVGLQKLLGLEPENIFGRDLKDFLVSIGAVTKTIENLIGYSRTPNQTKVVEIFFSNRVFRVKGSYFKEDTGYSGILLVFSDMTEQKAFETKMESDYKRRTKELENTYKELQQTNLELIKASEIKSQFVANVSHELRSPMNDIMGFVQLIQAKIYGPTTQKQDEALMQIMQNSNSLLKMINEILDVTKLDKGQMPLVTSKIHPREVIEQVIGGYSWIGEAKQLDVQVYYSNNIPELETDDTKLKRILINLLDNSVKFTESGHIHLRAENLPDEKMVLFSVEDTGIGISQDDQDIIFEPFRQIDGSTTRKYGGVGLGLYIVKKLVEMIGGEISLRSTLGIGTTFLVKIPYKMREES
jgi:PAS domain S-box-containing protein